jgi:hypothetical protein
MERTPFAGLLKLGATDSLSSDSYDFQANNPTIIDTLLKMGALLHQHDEHAALGNPGVAPSLTVGTGGSFAQNVELFVGYTFTDVYGGETLLSPIAKVNTGSSFNNPVNAPTATVSYSAGALLAGTYSYAVTVTDGKGGESVIGPAVTATVDPGFANSEITISGLRTIMEEVAKGAAGAEWRLWRITNASPWALVANGTGESVVDNGSLIVNCNVEPPEANSTVGSYKVTVTLPNNPAGSAVASVSLYACLDDLFESPCLVGVYPASELGHSIELLALAVKEGKPPHVSLAIQGAKRIDPDKDMIQFPWKRPVMNEGELPVEGNSDGDIREVISLKEIFSWNSTSAKWEQISGGTSFIVENAAGEALPAEKYLEFVGDGVSTSTDAAHERTIVTITRGTILGYRGSWASASAYASGDVVTDEGSSWVSLASGNTDNPPPTSPTWWGLLALKGERGASGIPGPGPIHWRGKWSSAATYEINDGVTDEGSSWVSTASGNTNHEPRGDGEVHWQLLAEAGHITILAPNGEELPPMPDLQFTGSGMVVKEEEGAKKIVVEVQKKIRTPHTFALQGVITVTPIPGFYVSLSSGQTSKLVKARYHIVKGTEAQFQIRRNGTAIAGFGAEANLAAKETAQSVTPTAVQLAEDDYLDINVVSVAGTPENLSITLVIEDTF